MFSIMHGNDNFWRGIQYGGSPDGTTENINPPTSAILQENGSFLLQENGSFILL